MKLTVALLAYAATAAAARLAPRQNQSESGQAGHLPLTIMGAAGREQYLTTKISIGTPPQDLNVELKLSDDGDLEVFASCPNWSQACFRPNDSSSFQQVTEPDGDGTDPFDSVTIGGVTADVRFDRDDTETAPSLTDIAGTLELDTRVSNTNASGNGTDTDSIWPPFQSQWPEDRVGIFLANLPVTYNTSGEFRPVGADAGTITLGGVNDSLYTGEIAYTDPVQTRRPSLLSVPLTSLSVNGQDIPMNDTAGGGNPMNNAIQFIPAPAVYIPRQYADQVGAALNASDTIIYENEDDDDDDDDDETRLGWAFPCDTNATISIGVNGTTFTINVADHVRRNETSGNCTAPIIPVRDNAPLLLGIPLIHKYVVLDYAQGKVGFADLSDAANSTSNSSAGTGNSGTGNSTGSNGTDSTPNAGGGNAAASLGPSLVVGGTAVVLAAGLVAF